MASMEKAVIVDALRTPIGRYAGALKDVRPDDLAGLVVSQAVQRNRLDPASIEDVFFGDANQAGEDNRNVARMAVLLAGLPVEIPAATMNRLCGSGMQAVVTATREIETGNGTCLLAGGVESMTRAPYILEKAHREFARGAQTLHDSTLGWRMVNPRLAEKYPPISLGQTAELVARRYGISRETQDRWALDSHRKAVAAQEACHFRNELVPVALPDGASFEKDEGPRADTSLEKLASLKPAFEKDGTVTAGNSSPLNDGAACLVLMAESHAERIGVRPLARVLAAASAGVDPSLMGLGPIPASRKAVARAGLR
ncbi:MAG TPA: thiolase family protein, partial [Candidatus Dormibacteraeota bacterium]